MPTVGSETASVWTTRGIYQKDPKHAHATGYDTDFPGYTMSAEGWWTVYAERDYLSGGFAWTGFDYRGEPSPFDDTGISSPMGMLDLCGFQKTVSFTTNPGGKPSPSSTSSPTGTGQGARVRTSTSGAIPTWTRSSSW